MQTVCIFSNLHYSFAIHLPWTGHHMYLFNHNFVFLICNKLLLLNCIYQQRQFRQFKLSACHKIFVTVILRTDVSYSSLNILINCVVEREFSSSVLSSIIFYNYKILDFVSITCLCKTHFE